MAEITLPLNGSTVKPETALQHGRLDKLAKKVDQATLNRFLLCRLKEHEVGNAEVEFEANKWEKLEENSLGKVPGTERTNDEIGTTIQEPSQGSLQLQVRNKHKRKGGKSRGKGEGRPRNLAKVMDLMDVKVRQAERLEKEVRGLYKAEKYKLRLEFRSRNKEKKFSKLMQ